MCKTQFVRWKRRHRKSRINKKWQKRYGAIYSKCPGVAIGTAQATYCCPCVANAIAKETGKAPQGTLDGFVSCGYTYATFNDLFTEKPCR